MSRPFGPSDQLVATVDQLIYSGAVRYQNPARVRDDVLSICPQIPSLLPRSGLLPSGGPGAFAKALLYLGGTIPVQYKGNTYNIPLSIWFPEGYPYEAPLVFVNPTANMIVTPQHPHVDESGRVRLQYLDQWADPRQNSNVLVLMTIVVQTFSANPPLRTRPQGPIPGTAVMGSVMGAAAAPPPPYNASYSSPPQPHPPQGSYPPPPQYSYPNPNSNSMIMSGSNMMMPGQPKQPVMSPPYMASSGFPLNQQQQQTTRPLQPQPAPPPYAAPSSSAAALLSSGIQFPAQPQQPSVINPVAGMMPPQMPEDPKIIAQRNAKLTLTAKVRSKMEAMQRSLEDDIEKQMLESSNYDETAKLLDQTKQAALKERDQLLGTLSILSQQSADLTKWIEDHERAAGNDPNLDDITDPSDSLLKQLFTLRAEDAAIEDVQYWLDKALRNGRIDLQSFLKTTRNYASEQFLKRALMKKIQDALGIRSSNAV